MTKFAHIHLPCGCVVLCAVRRNVTKSLQLPIQKILGQVPANCTTLHFTLICLETYFINRYFYKSYFYKSAFFLFEVPSRITKPPSDKTVTFGGNVTFTCRAEGVPEPQITWLNNLGIAADTDPRATVLPSGDLFIQNIELKDAGRYVCVAENSLGRDTAQVTLILTGLSKWHEAFILHCEF